MRDFSKFILMSVLIFFSYASLIQSQQIQTREKRTTLNLGKKYCDIKTTWLPLYNRSGPKKVCVGKEFRVRVGFENTGKAKCGSFKVSLKRGLRAGRPGRSDENTPNNLFENWHLVGVKKAVILAPGKSLRIDWKDKVKRAGDYRYALIFNPSPDNNFKNHSSRLTIAAWYCATRVDK